jgi:uncharacterized FlaG/YvyC family protein
MDVQALGSAVIVAPQADPAQSQNQTNNPSQDTSGITGVSSAASSSPSSATAPQSASKVQASSPDVLKHVAPLKVAASNAHPASQVQSATINVSYRFVQNPVQVVVVFTDAADGQQVTQVPPEYVVKLVQFDHGKGELVDRDA